jgi:hypothetical protein
MRMVIFSAPSLNKDDNNDTFVSPLLPPTMTVTTTPQSHESSSDCPVKPGIIHQATDFLTMKDRDSTTIGLISMCPMCDSCHTLVEGILSEACSEDGDDVEDDVNNNDNDHQQ